LGEAIGFSRKASQCAIGTEAGTGRRDVMDIGTGTGSTPKNSQSIALGTDVDIGTGCQGAQ
jgi:hypothetical protein